MNRGTRIAATPCRRGQRSRKRESPCRQFEDAKHRSQKTLKPVL